MYPILLKIGPITIYTVGVLHTLAIAVAVWWAFRHSRKAGIDPKQLLDLAVVIVVWAVVGARIFSILFDGNLNGYLRHPHTMLMVWEGGFTFYGGFLFGLAAGIWYVRKHKWNGWKTADLMAPALALGLTVGRLGCFFSGDSFGKPTQLPWGVTFTSPYSLAPTGIPLHPTQIYSVITNFSLFWILLWWQKRQRFQGELFLIFMMLYAVTRSFVEIFRNDPRGVYLNGLISTSQIISILVAAVAVWLYFNRLRKMRSELIIPKAG
ncbi:MAG: prolipoprotein diacylglyceryl transferase [Calditrichaeota bacterium]|nr:prolipoprotein diacylglyceryl transferase [Calditrichota bacterium]